MWTAQQQQKVVKDATIRLAVQQGQDFVSLAGPAPCASGPYAASLGPAQRLPQADGEAPADLVKETLACLHVLMIAVHMRMQQDQSAPLLFGARGLLQGLRHYPYQQLVGPLPGPPQGLAGLTLEGVTDNTWPWELPFLADLLSWLGALMWADEVGTTTFRELAMDFEAHARRALPAAPQAAFGGTMLPLQETVRVLRLALPTLEKLVKTGSLHPARVVTPCASLVTLGGPLLCGLSCQPCFACCEKMGHHVHELVTYCEARITLGRVRRWVYQPRRTRAGGCGPGGETP